MSTARPIRYGASSEVPAATIVATKAATMLGFWSAMYNQDLVTSNAISARRWYVSGSAALQQLVKRTFQDFNVSVYRIPERNAGGSLGALTPFAPAFHIIDHVIYHTTLDTPELVPA